MDRNESEQMNLFTKNQGSEGLGKGSQGSHQQAKGEIKLLHALVGGRLTGPMKSGLSGLCPHCKNPVVARVGLKRQAHWWHLGKLECEPSSSLMTEWHRLWQERFPPEFREIIMKDEFGELHRADIKTKCGVVVEIQYSPITLEERASRERVYSPSMIWIVNGNRLKLDLPRFFNSWNRGVDVGDQLKYRVMQFVEPGLLQDWSVSKVPVFFDFEEDDVLWCLLPFNGSGKVHVAKFDKGFLVSELNGTGVNLMAVLRSYDLKINPPPPVQPTISASRPQQLQYVQPQRFVRIDPQILRMLGMGNLVGGVPTRANYRSAKSKKYSGRRGGGRGGRRF